MSYIDVNKAVKAGLASATAAVGIISPRALKTYLVTKEVTGDDPFTVGTSVSTYTELVNAVWQDVDKSLIDGTNILTGDRMLVSDSSVAIAVGDLLTVGVSGIYGDEFRVISVDVSRPSNYVLSYKTIARAV